MVFEVGAITIDNYKSSDMIILSCVVPFN